MALKCPDCGVSVMSLMAHRCGRAKGSPELEAAFKILLPKGYVSVDRMQEAPEMQAPRQEKGSTPLESTESRGGKVKLQVRGKGTQDHGSPAVEYPDESQSPTKALVATRSKRGRPRIGETRDKPWLNFDPPMSERTWRRRLSEQRSKEGGK
jgi:hypothetical protein